MTGLWATYKFFLEHSKTFFKACHQAKFQKNIINRFRGKFKSIDFELKN